MPNLPTIPLDGAACGQLMPMHLHLDPGGVIRSAGPTLLHMRGAEALLDRPMLEAFAIRRPHGIESFEGLCGAASRRLSLRFRNPPETDLKGIMLPVGDGSGWLINLSFGISIVEAIRDYDLSARDFAVTDLAIEMLYLIEAKAAILDEWRRLNVRLQRAKLAAEEEAFTDTLTGLKNRRALDMVLDELLANQMPFGLLQIDLDFFKQVNDTLGHAAGDHVLQVAAQRMVAATRGDDTLIRAGGDEFVLIVPALVDRTLLASLGARLIAQIENPIPFEGEECRISASIGVSIFAGGSVQSGYDLMAAADEALYASKARGRGVTTLAPA